MSAALTLAAAAVAAADAVSTRHDAPVSLSPLDAAVSALSARDMPGDVISFP